MRSLLFVPALVASLLPPALAQPSMDEMRGDKSAKQVEGSDRATLFRDGNYGMFIHWRLYSHLGGRWKPWRSSKE